MSEIGYGPLERVDGPPPLPPLYGLLSAAEAPAAGVRIVVDTQDGASDINDLSSTGETMEEAIARLKQEGSLVSQAGQERWMNGVEVYPYPPHTGDTWDECGVSTLTSGQKSFGDEDTGFENPRFAAFTVYVSETCKSYRVWDQAAFTARATAVLAAVESSLVGRQLMAGEASPLSPHLNDGFGEFPNADTVTNPNNALAILENEIGLTGRMGVVHCSPGYATALRDRFQVDNRTGVIRTINGTPVIPDYGYANTANSKPHGHAAPSATQEWIYASGPIDIRRSEIFTLPETVEEALDRGATGGATTGRSNTITYRAERYYLVLWDTLLQAAVLADRCQTGC